MNAVRLPGIPWRAAHLAVLSSFALAQPLFEVFSQNATFFVARGSSGREIVLFALALILVPPAVLILVELGAGLIDPVLGLALHLFFIAVLVATIVLEALNRLDGPATVLLVAASLAGVAAAVLYRRARHAQSFLTLLSPAPLVFLALFLGASDVSKLVFDEEEEVPTARTSSQTPVVVVIFDEFSTIALMNEKQQIDRERYPNFASLADDSNWYRSATGVHTHSEYAVPAILTGQLPQKGLLPTAADHPRNIFTLFGGDYRLHVFESLTRLCPRSLCRKSTGAPQGSAAVQGGVKSLANDVSVVYLHLLLPSGLEHRVAPIGEAWGNFRGLREQKSVSNGGSLECARGLCEFIKALKRDRTPSVYFAHTLLPHVPWTYLPSGRRYTGSVRLIPGAEDLWRRDDWLTVQAYQRYLLQLAYTDLELGLVLDRLRSEGIYDRAVVVVTADHGLSFQPGEPRRGASRGNLGDVGFVPMFVKLPGQTQGRVVDGYARTIDVLPTIARAARTRIPWPVDGHPLSATLPLDGQISLPGKDGEPVSAPLSALLTERRAALARQIAEFGTGSLELLYRIGPHQGLLGKQVLELATEPSDVRVEIDQAQLLNTVDLRSEIIPAYVTGRILGGSGKGEELALALNGTIVATTRTYDDSGEERFQSVVPERMFHKGSNTVEVFGVRGTKERPALQRLRASSSTFVIRKRDGREMVETGEGTRLGIVPGALTGEVHAITPGESVILRGWAADLDEQQAADSVIVFLDGRSVLLLPVDLRQKMLKDRYGIERAGFRAELPKRLLPAWGEGHRLRILALRGQDASELRYDGGYLLSGHR